jgi:hypothetical protein
MNALRRVEDKFDHLPQMSVHHEYVPRLVGCQAEWSFTVNAMLLFSSEVVASGLPTAGPLTEISAGRTWRLLL